MKTLCMDTSHKYLALCIIDDDKIITSRLSECFKKQSEEIFPTLQDMLQEVDMLPTDIDSVCISVGPGSYTGVRIAMTIAKVMCSLKKIPLYKISTLKLYANNKENTAVVIDARSKRVYYQAFNKSLEVNKEDVLPIDKIDILTDFNYIGDASLLGLEDFYYDINECFLNTRKQWKLVEEVHTLVPTYLKNNDDYMVKK